VSCSLRRNLSNRRENDGEHHLLGSEEESQSLGPGSCFRGVVNAGSDPKMDPWA
jgi:hypothetical protein